MLTRGAVELGIQAGGTSWRYKLVIAGCVLTVVLALMLTGFQDLVQTFLFESIRPDVNLGTFNRGEVKMPTFLCRWQNGDISFVSAKDKDTAIILLDEVANAERMPISVIRDFMVHFHLTDEGALELEGFGDATEDAVWKVYPELEKAMDRLYESDPYFERSGPHTEEQKKIIRGAVSVERKRIKPRKAPVPQTLKGQEIKEQMGAPTVLIDKYINMAAKEKLKGSKPKGKPS